MGPALLKHGRLLPPVLVTAVLVAVQRGPPPELLHSFRLTALGPSFGGAKRSPLKQVLAGARRSQATTQTGLSDLSPALEAEAEQPQAS